VKPAGSSFAGKGAEDSGDGRVKIIGVYQTMDAAERAIARLANLPGIRDHTNGFHVDRYQLDNDHWVEGLIDGVEALGPK
jgi:hypothetical protein